ncbi:MAG: hypothetical protein MUO76_01675, partial [Anaerolineaceae bacterium]|nr:hypothetical protein [Anaerolineaceae bacterium]
MIKNIDSPGKLPFKYYFLLFVCAISISIVVTFLQSTPGFMDAEYYYGGGIQLASGHGFTEMILWNYLDDPVGLPHPSHLYWMPLASIVASLGMLLTNSLDFVSARIFFILIASLIPPSTAALAFQINGKFREAVLSGLLSLFSGFYIIYLTNTETIAIYMLLGNLFFQVAFKKGSIFRYKRFDYIRYLFLGILAGLMHLTRADGFLWLFGALIVYTNEFFISIRVKHHPERDKRFSHAVLLFLCVMVGYTLIMSPWYIRNWQMYTQIFPPGNAKALWITEYNQTFAYPTDGLRFQSWISSDWHKHLISRMNALIENIKTFLFVQGEIFLVPLIFIGSWRLRKRDEIRFAFFMFIILICVMSFIFPYAGPRGGFLHSGSALQSMFWVLVPQGLTGFLLAGKRWRNWNIEQAGNVFYVGIVILSVFLTGILFTTKVIGKNVNQPIWNLSWRQYNLVEERIKSIENAPDGIVVVNNPAGYFVATGRASIVIPDGDERNLYQIVERYGAAIVILENNVVPGLRDLYLDPISSDWLEYVERVGDA